MVALFFYLAIASPALCEWGRPIRIETAADESAIWRAAQEAHAAGNDDTAAQLLTQLLQSPPVMLDVKGRAVSVEAAVAGWLAELEREHRTELRTALAARVRQPGSAFRWYAIDASSTFKRSLAVLVDNGMTDKARALLIRRWPFRSWIEFDDDPQRPIDQITNGRRSVLEKTAPRLSERSWIVGIDDGAKPLNRDELVALRNWGVEPRLASQPVTANGRVYVRTESLLSAFDADRGDVLWRRRLCQSDDHALRTYERVAARVTTDILGTPTVDNGSLTLVADVTGRGDVAPSLPNLASASDRRRLGILKVAAATGDLEWAVGSFGVPLAAPVVQGESYFVPARVGDSLSLIQLDRLTGAVTGTFPAGELPDRDDRQVAPLYAAAITTIGDRVTVAFDEGIVACFNAASRSFEWICPIGRAGDSVHSWRLPERTDVSGGPGAILPRLGRHRASIRVIDNEHVVAVCPGWSAALQLRLHDGANITPTSVGGATSTFERDRSGVYWNDGDFTRRFAFNPPWQVNSKAFGPLPFSIGAGEGVYVQSERTLQRLSVQDFEQIKSTEPSPVAVKIATVVRGFANPATVVAGLFDDSYRLRLDNGRRATLIQARPARYPPSSVSSAKSDEWGETVTVESRELERRRFSSRYEAIPITRLAMGGPTAIAAAVNGQNRLSVKLRVDGHELDELYLPGRTGNARHEEELTRGWLCGQTLVLQLGRELFGVQFSRSSDTRSLWNARIAWPSDGGKRVGPKYSGLLPASAYASATTPAGALLTDESGRWAGNVAVTTSLFAIARDGSLLLFDVATGTELMRVCDRGVHEIVVADGERIWRVDAMSGQATTLDGDLELDQVVWEHSASLIRVDWSGRWIFDSQAKTITRVRWDGVGDAAIPCERETHVAFTADAACVWSERVGQLFLWRRDGTTFVDTMSPTKPVSRLVLVDAGQTSLVGLSQAVTTPGLIVPLQSVAISREIFQGELVALDERPDRAELFVAWKAELSGCAIRRVQPADLPIVLADWNAQFELPSGRLSSLHVGHYRVLDRRNGELIVEERTTAPRTPEIRVNFDKRSIFVEWGREQNVLRFSTDANNE